MKSTILNEYNHKQQDAQMCRLLAYLGSPITISSLLYQPYHSLIKQSREAQESKVMVNGDGFGISWYIDQKNEPGLFKTLNPAWNEPNLYELCQTTLSHCVSAHVRAGTVGRISRVNSHPFRYQNLSMMHNGSIKGFTDIKRSIRNILCDETYNWIEGQTDSEHFFALFVNYMMKFNFDLHNPTVNDMLIAFEACIATITDLLDQHSEHQLISLNTIITSGKQLLATRYANDPNEMRTLYYLTGNHYKCANEGHTILTHDKTHPDAESMIIIASERISDQNQEWIAIKPNHALKVQLNKAPIIEPINPPQLD